MAPHMPSLYRSQGTHVAVKVITRSIVDGQFVGHSVSGSGGKGSSGAAGGGGAGPVDEAARGDYDSLAHEIQILSRLSHPNVVHCYGGCLRPPRVFVVQGRSEGECGSG